MGVGSIVIGLLVWLMKNASFDRSDYEKQLKSRDERHINEVGQLRERIGKLEERLDKYHTELINERQLRWQAEDELARLRRGSA